jgi:hypothetical protein
MVLTLLIYHHLITGSTDLVCCAVFRFVAFLLARGS